MGNIILSSIKLRLAPIKERQKKCSYCESIATKQLEIDWSTGTKQYDVFSCDGPKCKRRALDKADDYLPLPV